MAAAQDSLSHARWNAAGLDAIHAGIAGADAVLLSHTGARNASGTHTDVLASMTKTVGFGERQRRQLAGLLKMKNTVAYEQRLISDTEASKLVDQANRFLRWAHQAVDADAP